MSCFFLCLVCFVIIRGCICWLKLCCVLVCVLWLLDLVLSVRIWLCLCSGWGCVMLCLWGRLCMMRRLYCWGFVGWWCCCFICVLRCLGWCLLKWRCLVSWWFVVRLDWECCMLMSMVWLDWLFYWSSWMCWLRWCRYCLLMMCWLGVWGKLCVCGMRWCFWGWCLVMFIVCCIEVLYCDVWVGLSWFFLLVGGLDRYCNVDGVMMVMIYELLYE